MGAINIQELVREIYDPSNRTIHVKDLIEAIVEGPLSTKVRENYGGQPTVPTPEETRLSVREVKWAIDQYLPRMQGWLSQLRQTIGGPQVVSPPKDTPVEGLVQPTPGLVETVNEFRREEREANQIIMQHLMQLVAAGTRIEKRVRNTRYLAVAILCVSSAFAAVAVAMLGILAWTRLF